MKKLRNDPYPNPINVDRFPALAGLDEDLRKEAMGLPVERSAKDIQFLNEAKTWLEEKEKREESKRIFESLGQKQQSQQRQVSNVRQRKRFSNERPKSFNHYFALLTAEREEKRRIEEEEYEEEQIRLEQKWMQRRDSSYWTYA